MLKVEFILLYSFFLIFSAYKIAILHIAWYNLCRIEFGGAE
jgi:hypothetical protein